MSTPKNGQRKASYEATLDARVRQLKPLAVGCSQREVSILAVAVEEMLSTKGFDAMSQLAIIQVESWIITHDDNS